MKVKNRAGGILNRNTSLWPLGWVDTKEGFCSWKVVTWLLEMESLTVLSVYPVWKKDLLKKKKNNILFKWCNTLALSRGQIETPWVTETQPCPLLAWKYRTIQMDCWGGRMGRQWKHVDAYWVKSFSAVDCHWNTHQSKQIAMCAVVLFSWKENEQVPVNYQLCFCHKTMRFFSPLC